MNSQLIRSFARASEEQVLLNIPVNQVWNGVSVKDMTLAINLGDDGYAGDLGVNWEVAGRASKEQPTGLLMRGLPGGPADEVGTIMGRFYWEREFNRHVAAALVAAGFSEKAAAGVSGSEWGMQDEGRASFDAYEIADELAQAMNVTIPE